MYRYAQCHKDTYIPTHDPWTVASGAGHPYGVPDLTALLVDAFTYGKYMNAMFYATALHCRTSENESYFHLVDVWLPMWAAFSEAGYQSGVKCCALTFNEQKRTKILTSGHVVKTKTHPDGILQRVQHRARVMEWRLKIMERVFPAHLVASWVKRERAAMQVTRLRREACVQFVTAA